jgi:hypothetical protein
LKRTEPKWHAVEPHGHGFGRHGMSKVPDGCSAQGTRWGRPSQLSTLALGTALLAHLASPAPAQTTTPCPSFAALGRRVDARVHEITSLKPGLPLREFTAQYARPALNFWDDVGPDRETVFFVPMSEGNADVSDELVCRFDRNERLRWCKKECCRGTTRTITKEQYDSLAPGDARAIIEKRLCSPSTSEVDRKVPTRVTTYYHIDLPVDHHDEGQTVMLIFEAGRLSSKGMSPYY